MTVLNAKKDFPILAETARGKPLVFLDGAASAQKPECVIDAISNYYKKSHANIHRGVYALSEQATLRYEAVRKQTAEFIHAASEKEIVFVKGTTEAINLVASTFGDMNVGEGDVVVVTQMEHHANIIPWQRLCERKGAELKVVPVLDDGTLDLSVFKSFFDVDSRFRGNDKEGRGNDKEGGGNDKEGRGNDKEGGGNDKEGRGNDKEGRGNDSQSSDVIPESAERLSGIQKTESRVKLVALTHVSNVLGTINPVKEMIALAHQHNVPVLVDGAQAVPHMQVDVQDLDADFYVFSAHKMYGPTGVGVLYAKYDILKNMPPYETGGGIVSYVDFNKVTYVDAPQRFEAGTPNIAGVVGMGVAMDYLHALGLGRVNAHEKTLLHKATEKLSEIDGVHIYGDAPDKAAVIAFTLDNVHAHDVATILDSEGVAVRAGHHCAMPLMQRFNVPAMVRASFGLCNDEHDIDVLVNAVLKAKKMFA